jgi:hypothetical protein
MTLLMEFHDPRIVGLNRPGIQARGNAPGRSGRYLASIGPRITSFEIGNEAIDLSHAQFMSSGQPFLEAVLNPIEGRWPEDYAAQDQERGTHGAGQQQAPDPAHDQQNSQLFGNALVRLICLAII